MARSEGSRLNVSPEEKAPLSPRSKTFLGLRSIASKILGALEQTLLILAVLVYSIFLAEIMFHVVVSLSIPLAVLHDRMVPASLVFMDALAPATEVFYNEVLGALLIFLGALLLPLTAGCCLHLFLLPSYFRLLRLACLESAGPSIKTTPICDITGRKHDRVTEVPCSHSPGSGPRLLRNHGRREGSTHLEDGQRSGVRSGRQANGTEGKVQMVRGTRDGATAEESPQPTAHAE
ncbi:Hypothetical predicted protein [Podarcis lilfordi]|uniref:Transmembrane protein n=1 Tax=Podarcis lilfordi TaxID=74358 RepID=A0AA35KWL2_9SAUR|nr:Hypothetical predicted protein [Podarcis lilfordi]